MRLGKEFILYSYYNELTEFLSLDIVTVRPEGKLFEN